MTYTVGSFEAKKHLSELLDRVEGGEHITITKHGRPVARLVPVVEVKPQMNWQEFWAHADTRLVALGTGTDIKADVKTGRARF